MRERFDETPRRAATWRPGPGTTASATCARSRRTKGRSSSCARLRDKEENPPDRIIGEDDLAFADFGAIFEEFEADFGRTFVFGDDPARHRLRDDPGHRFHEQLLDLA